jgi:LacI family transcriptional regulator
MAANDFTRELSTEITIRDVAARAGVSVATASRALSGSRPVSASNQRVVTKAADTLGYRKNRIAAALRRQVSDTIGLVVPQINNPFFPALIESVHTELQATTKQLLLCDSMQNPHEEKQRLQALLDHQVDGILISPCDPVNSLGAVRATASRVPIVQLDRRVSGEASDWVGVDDAVSMRLIAEHIAGLGAQSAIFVGAEPSSSSSARLRLAGFADAAAQAGVTTLLPLLGDFTTCWGVAAARLIVEASPPPDAVVCANDLIALGLLRQLAHTGIQVPRDVLVTGFDDIAAAELSIPSLTTIRQPYDALAHEALRLLTERYEQPDGPGQSIAVSPQLIVRESTGDTGSTPKP